jgi:hypothetical protein
MHEYIGNLHVHTTDSDGHASHDEVAEAALQAGLDFVVVTDHNIFTNDLDGYRFKGDQRVLLLVGQEVHDVERTPERSHLLVYGAGEDLSRFAADPQTLIDEATQRGGLTFLAHPVDCNAPGFDQSELSWVDWEVRNYTGLELWNFMSEFKCRLSSWPRAIYYSYFPSQIANAPPATLLERWDAQLAAGLRVVAIGNSDAHALPARAGPLRRVLFPYEWLFTAINTHVLLPQAMTGDVDFDRRLILEALKAGHCFVAYDRSADSTGFAFSAHSEDGDCMMGDQLTFELGTTLQVRCPFEARITMHHEGNIVQEWPHTRNATLTVRQPGAFRVEARHRLNQGWIYSNPIYLSRR